MKNRVIEDLHERLKALQKQPPLLQSPKNQQKQRDDTNDLSDQEKETQNDKWREKLRKDFGDKESHSVKT